MKFRIELDVFHDTKSPEEIADCIADALFLGLKADEILVDELTVLKEEDD